MKPQFAATAIVTLGLALPGASLLPCVAQQVAATSSPVEGTLESPIPETGPLRTRTDSEPDLGFLNQLIAPDQDVLRIGGEIRQQFESWRNREFGLTPESDDDFLLQRLYFEVDYRASERLAGFTEIGSAFKFGSPFEPSPIDQDKLFFQQLFADVTLLDSESGHSHLVIGRQTFSLGSGRLVATRNGPNIRRSFDAMRLIMEQGQWNTQLFVGADVTFGGGAFDNSPNTDRILWGVYATRTQATVDGATSGVDAYHLGYRNRRGRFDNLIGNEQRHSIGTRWYGRRGGWDYNIEPVVQFGSFGDKAIFAWTIANVVGYTFERSATSPRLGMKFDVISGDRNPGNGQLGTFNALFPNNSYFSEAAAFAPANLYDLNLTAEINLTDRLKFVGLYDFLWRFSTADAVYVPPGIPAVSGSASTARYIGNTVSLAAEWRPLDSVETAVAYVHLQPGDVLTDAGARQTDFVLLWATWFF